MARRPVGPARIERERQLARPCPPAGRGARRRCAAGGPPLRPPPGSYEPPTLRTGVIPSRSVHQPRQMPHLLYAPLPHRHPACPGSVDPPAGRPGAAVEPQGRAGPLASEGGSSPRRHERVGPVRTAHDHFRYRDFRSKKNQSAPFGAEPKRVKINFAWEMDFSGAQTAW
jgi:hypothetical protein